MKLIKIIFITFLFSISNLYSNEPNFNEWLLEFKMHSLNNGISEKTFNIVMKDAKFLPKVIEYDRFQPEFYEDTITYITKRSSKKKLEKGYQGLVMLPEIGLTNQFEKKFIDFFGFRPAIWHSGITKKNKEIIWSGIINGKINVVIGAR